MCSIYMYPYLISIVIILIMLISPKQDVTNIADTAAGKFFMIVFLILAIKYDIFLGLLVLVVILSIMSSTQEGMAGMRRNRLSERPKSANSKTNFNDPRTNKNETNSDITQTQEKVEPSSEKLQQNLNLNQQELGVIRELIRSKQRDPKAKCRRNCGNALLSCLDGCQVSDQMRKPISSKDMPVNNNTDSTENVEPNDEDITEGFTSF
jgi:hypothetical protein